MAKFNEKVLCLFNKDYKQLKKEAERRGMCHDGREKTIAKVIWKDAYDAGFTEGKNFASALSNAVRNCPASCSPIMEPKTHDYSIYDVVEEERYRVQLTDDQLRLLEWLNDKGLLVENDIEEWEEPYENVGRI